jgi:NhaA family Na+:H+ antiporter
MSLFIGLLAFKDAALQDEVKVGVIVGSLVSAWLGAALLSRSKKRLPVAAETPQAR